MSTAADRGKRAETLVKKKLTSMSAASNCNFYRWPDMRAGVRAAALTDFIVHRLGKLTLLEVKELSHSSKLPHKNLGLDQIAKARMWKASGAQAHVLINHTTNNTWRAVDIEWFHVNYTTKSPEGKAVGSWDLSDIALIEFNDYFESWL